MNRPILYGNFTIVVDGSQLGYIAIGDGIRAGAFVTSFYSVPANATYAYCVQSVSGANMFIKRGLSGADAFSDLYAITSLGRLVVAGTPGTYKIEIWIYDDEKLG